MRHLICAATGPEHKMLTARICTGKARHTTYAVAAHFGFAAVGIEHAHGISLAVTHQKQKPVGADTLLTVTDINGKTVQVEALQILPYTVDHHEIIARAVTLHKFQFHTYRYNSFKITNIFAKGRDYT